MPHLTKKKSSPKSKDSIGLNQSKEISKLTIKNYFNGCKTRSRPMMWTSGKLIGWSLLDLSICTLSTIMCSCPKRILEGWALRSGTQLLARSFLSWLKVGIQIIIVGSIGFINCKILCRKKLIGMMKITKLKSFIGLARSFFQEVSNPL